MKNFIKKIFCFLLGCKLELSFSFITLSDTRNGVFVDDLMKCSRCKRECFKSRFIIKKIKNGIKKKNN